MPQLTTPYPFPPTQEIIECPYPAYRELREDMPVHQAEGGEYIVARYEDVREVLKDNETFRSPADRSRDPVPHFAQREDPEHKNRRKMFQPAVAPGRLKQYSPMMRELADRLIDGFADSEADFLKQFADPFPVLVVARLLDLPEDDFDWHRWLDGFEGASVDYLSPERQAAYLERNASLFRYLRGVLVDRAASPRDDLFSEIVRSKREELDAAELADDVLDELATDAKAVIGAATANTTSMLASTLRLLIDHPHAMQAVLEERGHIGRIVEESLRLESPVQWSPRVAKRDAVLSGVAIPAGARVIVLLGSANRDRCEFADAEEFDPQRSELRRQLGFGFGSHTCLGAPLARVEGQIAFDALFDRLTNFELAPGGWVEGTHVEFRGPAKMQITFDRR